MSFLTTNFATPALVFIPNLLKSPAAANNTRSTLHPACPTRHPLTQYALIPSPLPSRVPPLAVLSPNPTSNSSTAPSIVSISPPPILQNFPLIDVTTSRPDSPLQSSIPAHNPPSLPHPQPPHRRGHRHTPESRRKIGIANRGNTPWNKGRRHSEETKRKIAENTKRAMLRPEMRQILQQRARGRRHSEATKLKIRETARLTRGTANTANRRQKKTPVPFAFAPHVVKHLNDCITDQIEHSFEQDAHQDGPKYIVREKRVVSEETRQRLSRRIKEMWSDPEYRSRVASGVEERYRRLAEHKPHISGKESQSTQKTESRRSSTKRRPRQNTKKEADHAEEAKLVREKVVGRASTNRADIVLDSDSLKGWTKEDLGIVGVHGAGRIDEAIMEPNLSIEQSLPQVPDEGLSLYSDRQLGLEPALNTEISDLDHAEFPCESQNSKLTSPVPAVAQDLNFSRLDLATDYGLSNSFSNHADFLDPQATSFDHEPLLDAELPGNPFDQVSNGDYLSESVPEKGNRDPLQCTGNDRDQDPNRSSFNFPEEGTNMFERF